MEQNPKIRIIHHSGQQRTIRLQLFNSWKLDSNGVTRYGWKTVDESTNEDIIKNFTADINAIAQTTAPIIQKKKDVVSAEVSDVNEVGMPNTEFAEEIELQDGDEPGETLTDEEVEKEKATFEAEKKEAPKRKRPPAKRKKK